MISQHCPDQEARVLNLYAQLMRATTRITEMMHRHLSGHRLSLSQFGVLEALYHLGPLCQKEIGNKILKSSGNITLVIDNLEKRGLVIRERDPQDRRRMQIRLSDKGLGLIQEIFPGHARTAGQVFAVLNSRERECLSGILKKLGRAPDKSLITGDTP